MSETARSPYAPNDPPPAVASAPQGEKPRPSAEELAAFVEAVQTATTTPGDSPTMRVVGDDGEIKDVAKDAEVTLTQDTLVKVAAFLDPTSRGPIGVLCVRHKMFAMRIPVQQEILDVTALTGAPAGVELNAAQAQWSIIGELRKAVMGWVPERSPAAHALRENIAWPKKWPPLNEPNWTNSRDPYIITDEILPLWDAYINWRASVVPTRDEIAFYWASQG